MSGVSKNAISSMRLGPKKEGFFYTLQVIDIKLIGSNRYRAVISDGEFYDQSFIGGPCHHFFSNGMIQSYQLIKIKDYSLTDINSGLILTINDLEPSTALKSIIGSPQKFELKAKPQEQKVMQKSNPNKENLDLTSIKTLNSSSKEFTIRARVTKKNEMKEWKNDRGTGKLFSINIIDSYNEEIQVTFFKEEADHFFGLIEEGKVYLFKNGQVKISNKRFQSVDCEYSICADKRTDVTLCADETDISAMKFNPVTIESISYLAVNTSVDICGGVIDHGEVSEILSKKTGKMMKKRTIRLIDQSNTSVDLTLWNEDATHPIYLSSFTSLTVAVKSCKTSNFNGISLSTDRNSTQIIYNPDLPQIKPLKLWLSRNPDHSTAKSLSVRGSIGANERTFKNFAEIKLESESEKENSYLIDGCIGYIRKDDPSYMFYTACANVSKCKKKVLKDSDGLFRCESCQESFENCEFKYILSIKLQDYSECLWATAFDDVASIIIGTSATNLHNTFINSIEEFEDIINKSHMQRIEGVVKVKFNDTPQGKRAKYVLSSVKSPDLHKSLLRNLSLIKEKFQ